MRNLHIYNIKYMIYKGNICKIRIHFNGPNQYPENKGKAQFGFILINI